MLFPLVNRKVEHLIFVSCTSSIYEDIRLMLRDWWSSNRVLEQIEGIGAILVF